MLPFNSVLVAKPDHFEVAYAINPYMRNAAGELNQVNQARAKDEWNRLVEVFTKVGLKVTSIPGVKGLPDIVFTANQSFPFWNPKTRQVEIILSHMRSSQRKDEVPFFKAFWLQNGFTVHELEYEGAFEGNGDAIFSTEHGVVFGGHGPRTDKEVYQELEKRFGLEVVRLKLCSADFYHLDTCFSILSKEVVAIQKEAFDEEGLQQIRSYFKTVVEIPYSENKDFFCGNCFCPDGKNVILQKGSPSFASKLMKLGFQLWEVETREFMKSGGSVFCLKLFYRS